MKTKSSRITEYNTVNYTQYNFRVRTGSELDKKLKANVGDGEFSNSFLITKLLCEYFDVEIPQSRYEYREMIYDAKKEVSTKDVSSEDINSEDINSGEVK